MSSSQLCDACYSCGMAFCSHDSTCLRLSCMVPNHQHHQVSDYISHPGPGMWLSSSSGHSPAAGGLQEFQFFGHDNPTVDHHRSLGLPHHHTAMVEPAASIKYQKNPRSNIPLTLDICSTTTTPVSSLGSTGGSSRPLDFPVTAQVPSSTSAVSWGSVLTDASASSGRAKEVMSNKTITGQGDSSSDREAKILRYREKKAMRNFEKQVRYESRKKYAEIRPRVRGRFAKNTNSDQLSSAAPEYNPSHYGTGWFNLSP